MSAMKLITANAELKDDKIEIVRYHSKTKFADANYLVRLTTGKPQTMSDGTYWDGTEHVGHYRYLADAIAAARDKGRGELRAVRYDVHACRAAPGRGRDCAPRSGAVCRGHRRGCRWVGL